MTKNSARKQAARNYQQANPGTTFPAAQRAVETKTRRRWAPGQIPAMRAATPRSAAAKTICYLCGNNTWICSFADHHPDTGRIQMYCEHADCAAREVEVIVTDDGTPGTRRRADVQALSEPVTRRPLLFTHPARRADAWEPETTPWARRSTARMACLFCGSPNTCGLTPSDDAADTHRIELHCTNPDCAVDIAVALVLRDGYTGPGDRSDVDALTAIDTPPAIRNDRREVPIWGVSELAAIHDADDKLARRIG